MVDSRSIFSARARLLHVAAPILALAACGRTFGHMIHLRVRAWSAWAAIFLVTAMCLAACANPITIRTVDPVARYDRLNQNALNSDRPSALTVEILRLLHLEAEFKDDPDAVLEKLNRLESGVQPESAQYALAELALLQGRSSASRDPQTARGLFLLAAAQAHDFLFQRPVPLVEQAFDPRAHLMMGVYNQATARFIRTFLDADERRIGDHSVHVLGVEFDLRLSSGGGMWDPDYFDLLVPAEDYQIRGLRHRHLVGGLGAPLIAVRRNQHQAPVERFYPPDGIAFPATAVLSFGPTVGGTKQLRMARLSFFDPTRISSMRFGNVDVPLAADLTAAFAALAASSDLVEVGRLGFFNFDRAAARGGLFLVQPYDPNRIPVIMIHGLGSNPLAWMELTNDLAGHPELRHHYQFWFYMYPTGLPYLHSGNQFRQSLEDLRRTLDPSLTDPAMHSMVIVAHSLGGLLAKTVISESGTRIWDATFTVSPEHLRGEAGDIERARAILMFSPKHYVRRVIFIATPHRGSEFSDNLFARLTSGTVKLPGAFMDTWRRLTDANAEVMTPRMRDILGRGGPTSIRALSPDHPLMGVLSGLPIDPQVAYHSIIADRVTAVGESASDWFVTYESAHLQGAESELIVHAGHDAYDHPLVIAEIKRILEANLRFTTAERPANPR